jgi:hypothetical protein
MNDPIGSSDALRVEVLLPEVAGDRVTFRWRQDSPNPFQRVDAFFFRYEGLDLSHASTTLLIEIFLGLQLKVFAAYDRPVDVVLPAPVPRSTVAFWTAYHQAERVTVRPITPNDSYSPWANEIPPERRPYAVFFGGGKDSTFNACLLRELYGPDQLLLIQFVGPLTPDRAHWDWLERRQEALMLQPARETYGVTTQRVWTDYQAQFRRVGYDHRPHLELYSLGSLPVLLAHGVELCTLSSSRMLYAIRRDSEGNRVFAWPNSRPEILTTQSQHYRIALGTELTVTNLHFMFTEHIAMTVLKERYPEALQQITMCTLGPDNQRWCYGCTKCAMFAFYSLAMGWIDDAFDYDHFLARSAYIQRVLDYAASGVELTEYGNAPWTSVLCHASNFMAYCHAIATLKPDAIGDRLSAEGWTNLLLLQALFGNRRYRSLELVDKTAIETLGHDAARRAAHLVSNHARIVDELPEPFLYGNELVEYDFSVTMPAPTAQVPHLECRPR